MAGLINQDLHLAFMAIGLVAGLSANERRVACAILDHFNKRTGQCDPGGERLGRLLDIDRTRVVKATARLCGEFGMFEKVSHGGGSHRASYRPQWPRFREIMREWNAKMRSKEGPSNVTKTPPSLCRKRHVERDQNVTQTDLINRIDRYGDSGNAAPSPLPPRGDTEQEQRRQARAETLHGLLRDSVQRPPGGRSPTHAQAARLRAEQRIDADLRSLGLHAYADAVDRMDEAMTCAAADAEMRRRGAGLVLIADRLGIAGGRGPPEAGGGSKL